MYNFFITAQRRLQKGLTVSLGILKALLFLFFSFLLFCFVLFCCVGVVIQGMLDQSSGCCILGDDQCHSGMSYYSPTIILHCLMCNLVCLVLKILFYI